MQRLTIELTGNDSLKALQELEHKHLIKILKESDLNSYSLPGDPISDKDFIEWVRSAENSTTVSITQTRQKWAEQRKKLQKLIR